MSCRRPLWNVLKTSWLENPRRSRARRAVLGNEGSGGGEVLARHDLGLLVGPVLGRGVSRPQGVEGGVEVALLVGRVTRLAQLVPARVAQHGHAVPVGGFRVVPQPGGRLHDVGVGVVDDPALRVGHVFLLPSALRACRRGHAVRREPVFQARTSGRRPTSLLGRPAGRCRLRPWAPTPRRGGSPRPGADDPSDRALRLGYAPRRWICATAPRTWRSARRSGASCRSTWSGSSPSWGARRLG